MQHSQGGGMGMQDMQRLQQQLQQAQYRQQQQAGGGPGSSNAHLMGQANGMQSQQFPGQFMAQAGAGSQQMGNTALAMMQQNPQQQQQQQQQQQLNQQQNVAGSNMSGSFQGGSMFGTGSFGNMNQAMGSSPMDASAGTSTRLMAMAGMNMNNAGSSGLNNRSGSGMDSTNSTMQNMQAIMQQQQAAAQQKNHLASQNQMGFGMQAQQQQQQQGQSAAQQHMFNQAGASQTNLGNSSGQNPMNPQQMMLQQQLANLQQQMQQGQQQQQNNANRQAGTQNSMGMQPGSGHNSSQNLLQQRQQQLLQQMQTQQRAGGMLNQNLGGLNQQGGANADNMNGMMQQLMQNNGMSGAIGGMNSQLSHNQQQQLQGGFANGPLTEQNLRIRQQNILRASGESQSMGADAAQASNTATSQPQPTGTPAATSSGGSDHSNRSGNGAVNNSGSNANNPAGVSGANANSDNFSIGGGGGMDGSGGHHSRPGGSGSSTGMPDLGGLNDSSTHSRSNSLVQRQQQQPQQQSQNSALQQQKSFLDGNFAGGWQSNADLPDRRKVIFSILEVIKQMRPNTNTTSTKLPHMAKSLEEHLYRSAQTKEEYLDPKTLKQRLQTIAQGLDLHRAPGQGNPQPNQGSFNQMDTSRNSADGNNWGGNQNMMQQQQQQMHGLQPQGSSSNIVDPWEGSQNGDQDSISGGTGGMQPNQDAMGGRNQSVGWANSSTVDMNNNNPIQGDESLSDRWAQATNMAMNDAGSAGGGDPGQPMSGGQDMAAHMASSGGMINPDYPNTPKYQDAEAAQKRKVILQQQQRLLLLRHASKCKNGPACTTKFCNQMVTLWRHMKTCRDKNCKTSHCLSSRCVLNHYRICKSQGKTTTCEVCGPVMAKIKQNGRDDVVGDPLAVGSQQQQQQQQQQQPDAQSSQSQQPGSDISMANRMLMDQRAQSSGGMQNPMQNQILPGADGAMNQNNNQMGDMQMQMQNNNQAGMMGMNNMNQQQNPSVVGSSIGDQTEQNQLQQLQQHQMKMQQQLDSLKNLQSQQQQLLDQQGRLQEQSQMIQDLNSPQAQQLRQQQMLLDQLQKRCQQQQIRLQQEIEMQSSSGGMQQQQQQQTPQLPPPASASPLVAQTLPQMPPPGPSLSSQSSVTSDPAGMDGSASRRKRRGSGSETAGLRNSGKSGKRGAGKGLSQGDEDSKPGATPSTMPNFNVEQFAQKKALVSSGPEERLQRKKTAQAELAPLAGGTSSLVSFMSRDMIMRHLESLNKGIRMSSRTVTHKCMPVLQALIENQFGWVFHDPVDPVALGLPDYFDVVKNPMNLALVKKKLENAVYADMELFARDVRLVFENAILYNGETSEVGELAQKMLDTFAQLFRDLVQGVESSQQHLESNGQACSLCGDQTRRYQVSVLNCRGSECNARRVKQGATYFTEQTKSNHWCKSCYDAILPDQALLLDDGTQIKKAELKELANDALPEEAWVNCDECQAWVHQVCALFNGRTNRSNAKYSCPKCILKRGDTVGFPVAGHKFVKGAADLGRCKMSDAIESGLQKVLEHAYADRAKELGVDLDSVERAEGLLVRVLSNVEKKHYVGDEMVRRYESENCPKDYPVRSKCIALFQNIHGVDTMLFAMYVYEYDQSCPAPNRRRVYISYLDSVQYFEPKCYRTTVYQAILMEYLRFVKDRGFHTAHIWSCPPAPDDDYIFFMHPSHQRFPREDMLRAWYHKMLERAKSDGVVIRTTTLYDEYFNDDAVGPEAKHSDDPLRLPYFEGDYIPGEIETIIKQLNTKGVQRTQGAPDDVMLRLKHNIGKMKENFIVVHLRNRRFAAAVERGEDVSSWPEDSDEELVRSKRAKISGKEARPTNPNGPTLSPIGSVEPADKKADEVDVKAGDNENHLAKRGLDEIEPAISSHMSKLDRASGTVGDTSEEDAPMESDLFESRQQFLNYCQTNHCQFDELRRAKHSTMMALFQLHNPTAPKFLHQCSACYRDITHGLRYHCGDCPNFDLCEECYEPVTTGLWAQKDDRFKHDQSHSFAPIDMESSDDPIDGGSETKKDLKAHIQLLEHSGSCTGSPSCQLQNCEKMKRLFEHVKSCEIKPKMGCKVCTRLLSLCVLHARTCPARGHCSIPFCDRIRERNQRVRLQQQLMDERRRQAQNELYHTGGDP